MKKELIKIADNERFDAHIELIEDAVFIHTTVHEWSKRTMQEMQMVFDSVLEKCEQLGVNELCFYGTKDEVKLAKSFGPLEYVEQIDDKYYTGAWLV